MLAEPPAGVPILPLGWRFGAPERMKLRASMSLSLLYNFFTVLPAVVSNIQVVRRGSGLSAASMTF